MPVAQLLRTEPRSGRSLPAPPDAVFAFLAELGNHWRLLDRWTEIVSVDDDGQGSTVRMRGPLGVRRTARTRLLDAQAPSSMTGEARVGRRTTAIVRWTLEPEGAGTRVHLAATVPDAAPLDRLLLAVGGEHWLRRRFDDALQRLDAEVLVSDVRRDPAAAGLSVP